MSERDLAALAAANGGTLFKYLSVGDRFVFSLDHYDKPYAILIKTARGYRHEGGGRVFKTGARTAVYKVIKMELVKGDPADFKGLPFVEE